MTAQEKAKDLAQEYFNVLAKAHNFTSLTKDKSIENVKRFEKLDSLAKQCALIAVDKILNIPFEYEKERQFFQEVKQEIEKL